MGPTRLWPQRKISDSRAILEARWICDNPIINDVAVLDPVFNSGALYLDILKELISGGFSGKLSLQCRLEMVKPEFLDLCAKLNAGGARTVLEFGLQTIHKNETKFIERALSLSVVEKVLKQVVALGIESEISLIYGLPGQTVDSFRASVEWVRKTGVQRIRAFPLMLLRGTELHRRKGRAGACGIGRGALHLISRSSN